MTATTHVETEWVQGRRLGRRPAKNAPHLKLADVLTGIVPDHPLAADNLARATYGLYQNDQYGDCGPTSVANQRRQVTAYLTGAQVSPTQADVFDLYRRSGNPNFDPTTGADDNGVDMQTMLEAVQSGGIGGVKCVAFAKVDHTNLDEVRAAIAIFGSVLFGVTLQTAQQSQTDSTRVWDYAPSSVWGGHAVVAGKYTSAPVGRDIDLESWAEEIGVTDAFCNHQLDEVWVVVWPEHLGTAEFQQGVDQAKLAAAFEALTGKQFPARPTPPVPPAPPVGPVVDPADEALVADLRHWLTEHHAGDNRRAVAAVVKWMASKGLTLAS